MIEFKNVSKVYDNGSVALDDVCLTIMKLLKKNQKSLKKR